MKKYKFILYWFLLWRLFIGMVALIAERLFPYTPTFPYATTVLPEYGSRFLTTWAQFDGVHYLAIITRGYEGTALIQAFFPVYPMLVRFLTFGILNPVTCGILISLACFGAGLVFFYKLMLLDETNSVAKKSLVLLLLSPTSFYFSALYTESLFFLSVILSFYAARKGHWFYAGIFGAVASGTRIVGVFMVPALLWEFFNQRKKFSLPALSGLIPTLGILGYMGYLKSKFNDPFLFYHAQEDFGTSRESGRIILLYQVIYRYIKMFLTVPVSSGLFYTITQEFISGILGISGLIIGWFVTRPAYVIFGLGAYLVPTLTGTFSSLPRYLLPIFPIYIVIAKLSPRWLYLLVVLISAIMLVSNIILFTRGMWVS